MINLIDTHFHLDYYENHKKIYDDINKLKQYTLCVTNVPEVFESCFDLYKQTKYLKFALGYNPQMIKEIPFNKNSFLRCLDKTKYIGEVGLDFSKNYIIYKNDQLKVFDYICNVAARNNKILSIHSRKAEKEVLMLLKKNRVKYAIMHWYTGSCDIIDEFIKQGYYFSVNPSMMNSISGKRIIKHIPLEKILVESDGPMGRIYGKRIVPNNIIEIYNLLNKELDIENSIEKVFLNFRALLTDRENSEISPER